MSKSQAEDEGGAVERPTVRYRSLLDQEARVQRQA